MATSYTTGAILRGEVLCWTTYRRTGRGPEKSGSGEVPLGLADLPAEAAARQAAEDTALRQAASKLRGHLSISIPTDQVLLRVMDLPSTDPAELSGMVDLKVDRISPFPIEHMVVSFEVLQGRGDSSRVLVAAAKRDYIESLCGRFLRAGKLPSRMDVEILGWLNLIAEVHTAAAGAREIFLIRDEAGLDLVVMQDGAPVLFSTLGSGAGLEHDAFAAEISEEMHYTLTTLEAQWGNLPGVGCMLWSATEKDRLLAESISRSCGFPVEWKSLAVLPPLTEGLARRALVREGPRVDLTPGELHNREATRALQFKLLKAGGVVVAVWLLFVVVFLSAFQFRKGRLGGLREQAQALEGPASEVQRVMEKIEELAVYKDKTHSAIEALREIAALLPPGFDLTSFNYRKGREVSLKAETSAQNAEQVWDFYDALDKSELFSSVEKPDVATSASGGGQKARFGLKAYLPGGEEKQDEAE